MDSSQQTNNEIANLIKTIHRSLFDRISFDPPLVQLRQVHSRLLSLLDLESKLAELLVDYRKLQQLAQKYQGDIRENISKILQVKLVAQNFQRLLNQTKLQLQDNNLKQARKVSQLERKLALLTQSKSKKQVLKKEKTRLQRGQSECLKVNIKIEKKGNSMGFRTRDRSLTKRNSSQPYF